MGKSVTKIYELEEIARYQGNISRTTAIYSVVSKINLSQGMPK